MQYCNAVKRLHSNCSKCNVNFRMERERFFFNESLEKKKRKKNAIIRLCCDHRLLLLI